MKTSHHKITIDLVPYDVELNARKAVIKNSTGSILGKLNNNPLVTNFESSEHKYTVLKEGLCVEVSVEENDVVFKKIDGRKRITFDDILNWISLNFYRIDSIGWEALDRVKKYDFY